LLIISGSSCEIVVTRERRFVVHNHVPRKPEKKMVDEIPLDAGTEKRRGRTARKDFIAASSPDLVCRAGERAM
jgi:hypothetical protein